MFESLVKSRITRDTSIEITNGTSGCFMLRSIDKDSLSGEYDDNSYVKVDTCTYNEVNNNGITTEYYSCENYETMLVNKDRKLAYKAYKNKNGGSGSFILQVTTLADICNGGEWCPCS